MPYDEAINIDLGISEATLDKLDRDAGIAEKNLERIQKAREKATGIFATGARSSKTLPKSTQKAYDRSLLERDSSVSGFNVVTKERIKGQVGTRGAPIQKNNLAEEVKKQKSILQDILASDMGASKAQESISFLRDPLGKVMSFLQKEVPIVGGIIQIAELSDAVIKELTKKGGFLDVTFRYTIDNLKDALRTTVQQMSIQQGFTQLILVMKSGSTSPRDAYNTYNEYNKNNSQLESDFAIRNTRGI